MQLSFYIVALLGAIFVTSTAYEHAAVLNLKQFAHIGTNEQFFAQDSHGQYTYGYRVPQAEKQEFRTFDGVTRGYYSFIDAAGKQRTVQYIADSNGFHVIGSDNLQKPQAVTETPEVAAARAQHLAAHQAIKLRDAALLRGSTKNAALDLWSHPVKDTAEVAAAKAEFFKRYQHELLSHKLLRGNSISYN